MTGAAATDVVLAFAVDEAIDDQDLDRLRVLRAAQRSRAAGRGG